MYSQLFCGTLDTSISRSNGKKGNDALIKMYKIALSNYQELASSNMMTDLERQHADRFHFVKDKNRFVICRVLLKFLLAEYIGLHVDEIYIEVDSNKKPYLPSHPFVFFNLTHSTDFAMIAIAKSPIGVDIEYINKEFGYKEIIPTVYNKPEIDEISNSINKHHTFYKFWTRKEAIVKTIGKGIDDDLIKIPVTDGLHSVPSHLIGYFKMMNVFSFDINDDYIGSLAITEDAYDLDKILFYPLPNSDILKSIIS